MTLTIVNRDGWSFVDGACSQGLAAVCPMGNSTIIGPHVIGALSTITDNPLFTRSFCDLDHFPQASKCTMVGYVRTTSLIARGQVPVPLSVLPAMADRAPYQTLDGNYAAVDYMGPGNSRAVADVDRRIPPFYAINSAFTRAFTSFEALSACVSGTGSLVAPARLYPKALAPSLFGVLDLSPVTQAHLQRFLTKDRLLHAEAITFNQPLTQTVVEWLMGLNRIRGPEDVLYTRYIGHILAMTLAGHERFNPLACAVCDIKDDATTLYLWQLDWDIAKDVETNASADLFDELKPYLANGMENEELRRPPRGKGRPAPLDLVNGETVLTAQVIDAVVGYVPGPITRDRNYNSYDLLGKNCGYRFDYELVYDASTETAVRGPITGPALASEADLHTVAAALSRFQDVITGPEEFSVDSTGFELVGAPGLYPAMP